MTDVKHLQRFGDHHATAVAEFVHSQDAILNFNVNWIVLCFSPLNRHHHHVSYQNTKNRIQHEVFDEQTATKFSSPLQPSKAYLPPVPQKTPQILSDGGVERVEVSLDARVKVSVED